MFKSMLVNIFFFKLDMWLAGNKTASQSETLLENT